MTAHDATLMSFSRQRTLFKTFFSRAFSESAVKSHMRNPNAGLRLSHPARRSPGAIMRLFLRICAIGKNARRRSAVGTTHQIACFPRSTAAAIQRLPRPFATASSTDRASDDRACIQQKGAIVSLQKAFLASLFVAALGPWCPAGAETSHPFCSYAGSSTRCDFDTYEQCAASVSGTGADCMANPSQAMQDGRSTIAPTDRGSRRRTARQR